MSIFLKSMSNTVRASSDCHVTGLESNVNFYPSSSNNRIYVCFFKFSSYYKNVSYQLKMCIEKSYQKPSLEESYQTEMQPVFFIQGLSWMTL